MAPSRIPSADRDRLATDGFVHLAGALSDDLLERWRSLAARLEHDALDAHRRGEPCAGACVVSTDHGPLLVRQDDLHQAAPEAVLDLLASPAMMAIARDLCGRGAVPLQVDLLYKHPVAESAILWHQGAPHPRSFPYLNVGVYLDDADPGDGCVRYVPGTQHGLQDIAGLTERHGWDLPDHVEVQARAGDVIVQDMMVLHASPPKVRPGTRRTVYVEIRPSAGIVESAAQTPEWGVLRERWMALVVRRAGPDAWPQAWRDSLPTDIGDVASEMAAIAARHEPPIPSVYAARPVRHPSYP